MTKQIAQVLPTNGYKFSMKFKVIATKKINLIKISSLSHCEKTRLVLRFLFDRIQESISTTVD